MTDRSDKRAFYMICRAPTHKNAQTAPKARYAHFETAQDEARKLARQTGAKFVVLGVLEIVEPKDDLTGRLLF